MSNDDMGCEEPVLLMSMNILYLAGVLRWNYQSLPLNMPNQRWPPAGGGSIQVRQRLAAEFRGKRVCANETAGIPNPHQAT